MPSVIMGRVQRRPGTLAADTELRPFREDMAAFVERGRFRIRSELQTWVASDLAFDVTGDFVTGLMGFASREVIFSPDEQDFSWLKAEVREEYGGTNDTITPFAVDVREERRWIGFVQRRRVREHTFAEAFTALLQAAVTDLGLIPAVWEVDIIPRPESLREWVAQHPNVAELVRVVKMPNPSRHLDEDRAQMRALGAVEKDEHWKPDRGRRLELDSEVFREFESDMAEGYVELTVFSRAGPGAKLKFSSTSRRATESTAIPSYGSDLSAGISAALQQVGRFSRRRAGEGQQDFDGNVTE